MRISNAVISLIDHTGIYEMPNICEDMLPNPRSLSTNLVNDENSTDPTKTMMMAYWTIFIGHDLSHTAVSTTGIHIKHINIYKLIDLINANVRLLNPKGKRTDL